MRDLESAKPEIRAGAIPDLVRHARLDDVVRAKAIGLIAKRLKDDNVRVRAAAAIALGDLRAKEHVDVLLLAVEDDDPSVRQMALNALGEIADERSLPRLRRALSDKRPEVRYQAIIAFARVAEDAADVDRAILDATNDDDDAIGHIAFRIAEERLDDGHEPDPRIVARAHALVKNGAPSLALVAAILLAKTGDESVKKLLLDVVRTRKIRGQKPEKEDEQAAVELMGQLGMREAIPELEKRVWGLSRWVRDTASFHARIALARLGHARACAEILKDLDSSRSEVRSAAVVAAGRGRVEGARAKIEKLTSAAVDPELVAEALEALG